MDDVLPPMVQLSTESALDAWTPEPGAPRALNELVGQPAAKHLIERNLQWAARTSKTPVSMLLYGPSGYGKSLIAGLTSREVGLPLVHVSMADLTGSDLDVALDMAARGGVLFLDEMQAGPRRLRDRLLVALDPGRPGVPFAIAATTDPGALSIALRRRFPLEIPLQDYSILEAETVVRKRSDALGITMETDVPYMIARAARSNPARITRLLVEAALVVEGTGTTLSANGFTEHLAATGRDDRGVDSIDLELMVFLRDECEGPAGLGRLADAVGLDRALVQERISMLRKEGLMRNRGRQGHELTPAAAQYLSRRSL
jgi:Holliday junction resolvasome RuvABC ATP-dependent DNA helicase subunit